MSHSLDDSARQEPRTDPLPDPRPDPRPDSRRDSRLEVDRLSPTVPLRPRDAVRPELRPDSRPADATDPLPDHCDSIQPTNRITPNRNRPTTPIPIVTSLFRRGQRVGDYEILEELGRGGMGVIYKAKQAGLNRTVALKMVLRGDFAHFEELIRFRTEAQAIGRLHHPNLVNIFEIGDHDGLPFYAMEFLEGGTLSQRLAGKRMVPQAAARLMLPLVQAIEYAHTRGIIHRDLKPSNILFASATATIEKNVAKITDFGVAKHIGNDSGLTRTGDILGTPSYMAPEQATGKSVDVGAAADVYSLGAILYETLTGRAPFVGADPADTLLQMLNNEPAPVRKINPKVPVDLETICLKCLEKDPARRYPSAGPLAEDLRRFLADEPILARPAPIHQRARKWVRRRPVHATMIAAGVLLTIVGVGSLVALWQQALAKAKVEADLAKSERASADKTQTLLADALLERGIALAEKNDVRRGMHWMIRSLETAEKVSDRDPQAAALAEAVRYNLAHWGHRAATPEKLLPHGNWAWTVAFTPDGQTVLTGGRDNRLIAWDTVTGQMRGEPHILKSPVWSVVAQPAGPYVFAGTGPDASGRTQPGEICVYRQLPNNGPLEPVGTPLVTPAQVATLKISPDGTKLLALLRNSGVILYQFDPLADHPLSMYATVSPFGFRFGEFSGDSKKIYLATAAEVQTYRVDLKSFVAPGWSPGAEITAMTMNADRSMLAIGAYDFANPDRNASIVDLWKVDELNPQVRPRVLDVPGIAKTLAFSPDGRHIAVSTLHKGAGSEIFGHVRVAEVHYQHSIGRRQPGVDYTHELYGPQTHSRPVWAIQFHPSGKYFATGCEDGTSRIWELATGQPLTQPLKHEGTVVNLAFNPQGTHLVTASAGGSPSAHARLTEMPSFAALPTIHHQKSLHCIAWEDDGRHYIAQDQAIHFTRWDSQARTQVALIARDPVTHAGMWFSDTGVVRERNPLRKRITIFDGRTLKKINEVPDFDVDYTPEFTFADHTPLYNAETGKLCMYHIADNRERGSADFPGRPSNEFGHVKTGRYAAIFNPPADAAAQPCEVRVWDLDMKELAAWKLPNRSHNGLFNASGNIVGLRGDYQFRFFDLRTGEQIYKTISHDGRAHGCVFHPREDLLLFASGDGQIGLWHIASSKAIGKQPDLNGHPMFISPRPDGTAYLAGARDRHIIEWPHLEPKTQSAAWLKRWVENLTGMTFDSNDELTPIDAPALVARRQVKD